MLTGSEFFEFSIKPALTCISNAMIANGCTFQSSAARQA